MFSSTIFPILYIFFKVDCLELSVGCAVKTGEKVRFFITTTTDVPSCFIIDKEDVYLSAINGDIVETEIFFKRAGQIKYYCPTGKISGTITVLERERDRLRRIKRELASKKKKKKVKVWMPKEKPKWWKD